MSIVHHIRIRIEAIWNTTRATDRGDVPGWVLVTVMTAGLVAALWLLADSQLKSVLTDAITAVTR